MTEDAPRAERPWCAIAQYPGLGRFRFGTLNFRARAPIEDVKKAMEAKMAAHFPPGFEVIEVIPGAMVFVPRGYDD